MIEWICKQQNKIHEMIMEIIWVIHMLKFIHELKTNETIFFNKDSGFVDL